MKNIKTALLGLLVSSPLLAQIPTNGLVGYYPFSGNANDLSGNGNNGVVSGATLTTDRFGNTNSAFLFNGTSNFIEIPASVVYGFTNSFTVNMWVKMPKAQTLKTVKIFEKYACPFASNTDYYGFGLSNDTITFGSRSEQGNSYNSSHKLYEFDKFIMITGIKDYTQSKLNFYVNGFLATSIPINSLGTNNSNVKLSLGKETDCSTKNPEFFYKGVIDDVRIYNRALTTDEITALVNENIKDTCINKIAVSDTLIISRITTGLNELPLGFGTVKIYPNPATSVLNVAVSNPSADYTLKIYDSSINEVYTNAITSSIFQISLNSLGSSGLYFIQIIDKNGNPLETKKLIIE